VKYYYVSKSGVDIVFIEVSSTLITMAGYEAVKDDKYDFSVAKLTMFQTKDKPRFGDLQEIESEKFWKFAVNPAELKRDLVKTVFKS
jgi:hypothetical protein